MAIKEQDPFEVLENEVKRRDMEEKARYAIKRAKVRFVLDNDPTSVFFTSMLMSMEWRSAWGIGTACTDGKNVYYDPAFIVALKPEEVRGVIAHETLHPAYQHHARRDNRDPRGWNIAADLAINPILKNASFVLPSGALFPGEGPFKKFPKDKAAEEYYGLLPKIKVTIAGGKGDDPGGCGGVKDAGDEAQCREAEAEWKMNVAKAAQLAKQRGTLPGSLNNLVAEILEPKVDWRDVLREFISKHSRNDYSWSQPNRRYIYQGLYLPSLRSEELGEIVIAVDTSGSVYDQESQNRFASEMQGILEAYDCTVTIIFCDAKIHRVDKWSSQDGPMNLRFPGGGGTSHVPVFKYIEEHCQEAKCAVLLTDLYTDFPKHAPDLPCLWIVVKNTDPKPPFGMVVKL